MFYSNHEILLHRNLNTRNFLNKTFTNFSIYNSTYVSYFYVIASTLICIMCISLCCSYTSISNFTLNLLEDSGWYKVDYAVAESLYNYELLWGKGEG